MNDQPTDPITPNLPAPEPVPDNASYSLAQQIEFTRKELRETLRDRRTIVTLIAMPLLLYPLLGFGLRFIAFQQPSESQPEYRLAIETEAEALWLSEALQFGSSQLAPSDDPDVEPDLQVLMPEDRSQFDMESAVNEFAADLGVHVEWNDDDDGNRSAVVQIVENEGSLQSRDAADYIQRRLSAANIASIQNWAKQRGQDLPIPIQQTRTQITLEETGSAVLGLLPLVLLLMTVTGGVYPAIDLTAGERERNTMETLMAFPVPRFRLLAAKYVAVVTVTMLTGLMNLLAMSVTLYALQLDVALLGDDGFTIGLAAKLFLALTAFALFYSAVLLLLTSSARSFKEAQAYLIPLLLISIAPGLVILMPGWNLAGGTAAIPLVNILLLARELLEGTVQLLPAMVAIISTVFYGAAALALAAQVFGSDAVAVGSRGRWHDLLRRPNDISALPSLTLALSTLALLFPMYFIVSGILARGEAQPTARLVTSAVMTIVLFVGVTLVLLGWQRVSRIQGLGLKKVAWPYLIAASLFGLATWPLVFELVVLAQGIGIRGFDPEQIDNVEALLSAWKQVPLVVVVLCLGVVPGVCEEAFFRGFLFNGLKQHLGAVATIAVSAISFGLFHVVLSGGAAPERILPSTAMGVLLGWIAWKSDSVIPSMILHAVHNSTLLIVVQSRDLLARWSIGQMEQEHLPLWWLAFSASVLVAGIVLVRFFIQNRVPGEAQAA
ncbi:MAG: ABC transporter permease subunit/CPBP intramembrane protease [Rhodopirellula sp. JB055]|uniref:ABC transporter permease subunit/CPBP intramembrane protease n=1 Tax=Rhodopirellula sp. JB055 TaxID=3342846 RepID=UPI00370C5649